jgi:hypothetical protein
MESAIGVKLSETRQYIAGFSGWARSLTAKHARAVIQSHHQQILESARNDDASLNDGERLLKQQIGELFHGGVHIHSIHSRA